MHVSKRTTAAVAAILALTPLGVGAPAAGASGDHFVVDTQFFQGQSLVTEATGVFAGCKLVKDLFGDAVLDGDVPVGFFGVKRVICGAGAKIVLEYDVAFDAATGTTEGTWTAVSSTLDGVDAGDGGPLSGSGAGCTIQRYAGGCVTDTFVLD